MSIRPAVGARGSRADLIALLDRRGVALALAAATVVLPIAFVVVTKAPLDQPFAKDLQLYTDAAARWLAGGGFYDPRQLAGPYDVAHGDILYPPVGLWLFVPAAVLPQPVAFALWWGIPAAITVMAVVRVAPRPAVWPLITLCLAWPTTPLKIWTGNPVIWCMAAMAVAIVWRGGAPFALLKPSLFPFAFFGIRQRSWWIDTPSLTDTVLNSMGVPPAARMPSLTNWASRRWLKLHGIVSIHVVATPTSGLARSSSVKPIALSMARAPARSGPSVSAVE